MENYDHYTAIVKFDLLSNGRSVNGLVSCIVDEIDDINWGEWEFWNEELFKDQWRLFGPSSIPAESIDLEIKSFVPCIHPVLPFGDDEKGRMNGLVFSILSYLDGRGGYKFSLEDIYKQMSAQTEKEGERNDRKT